MPYDRFGHMYLTSNSLKSIWEALRHCYHLRKLKKREKPTWKSDTFSTTAGFILQRSIKFHYLINVFHIFLKLYKCYQIVKSIIFK